MTKMEEKTAIFYQAILNAYREEELQNPVKTIPLGGDATEDITALIYACFILFQRMTEQDRDIIDFTHIVNKLVVQHLMEELEAPKEDA